MLYLNSDYFSTPFLVPTLVQRPVTVLESLGQSLGLSLLGLVPLEFKCQCESQSDHTVKVSWNILLHSIILQVLSH